jgi:hypothetical protein
MYRTSVKQPAVRSCGPPPARTDLGSGWGHGPLPWPTDRFAIGYRLLRRLTCRNWLYTFTCAGDGCVRVRGVGWSTIYECGAQIAVIAEKFQIAENRPASALYVVDQAASRTIPIRVPGCDTYHDVAYDAGLGRLLLCGSGRSARVHRLSGTSWTTVSLVGRRRCAHGEHQRRHIPGRQ